MWNSIGSWFCIMGLIIGPFSIGVVFEEKLQRANRELGSRPAQVLDAPLLQFICGSGKLVPGFGC